MNNVTRSIAAAGCLMCVMFFLWFNRLDHERHCIELTLLGPVLLFYALWDWNSKPPKGSC